MGLDFENVSGIYSAEVPYVRREPARYMEAKITRLHKHLSTVRKQDEDDDGTVITVVTPTVCSSDYSWRTGGSMSTISTFSSGSHVVNRSLLTSRPSRLHLQNSISPIQDSDWGYFVDVAPKPDRKCTRRSFMQREIAATKNRRSKHF